MLAEILSDVRYRLRALFARESLERELDDELRFHLQHEIEKHERLGMSRAAAIRRARLEFGGVERMKDASRDVRGTARLEAIAQDLRYAIRSLRARPVFTVTVVATLAVGIGATTAIFTLIDGLLLRRLPVPHPEQLVIVSDPAAVSSAWNGSPQTDVVSFPLYRDVRDRNTVLSGLYANGSDGGIDVTFGADERSVEHPTARFVTGNFFSVLGVPAYAGRVFTADDDRLPGQDPVAVITYDYWQRRFSGSSAAIGSIMRINHVPITIIGVTPPGFAGDIVGQQVDFWLPMMMNTPIHPRAHLVDSRDWSWLVMMGRLKPGVTLAQARRELAAVEANAIREHVAGIERSRFDEDLKNDPVRVEPGARGFSERRAEFGRALWILMAAVLLVTLVVCANVSALMLARTMARGREMTVRMTLGAGRRRLIQQMLVECSVLAVFAGVMGSLIAVRGGRLLLAMVANTSPMTLDVTPNARVVAFTGATTIACVLLFGLLPAFRATRVDLATSLRAQGRNLMGGARVGRVPFGRVLVVAQIALSMLLLMGGGLLVRSMQQLVHSDIGVDRDHIVTVHVRGSRTSYTGARLRALRLDLAQRARQVPGVVAAAFAENGLFSGGTSGGHVDVPGFVPQADSERQITYDRVGAGYFQAIGAHLLRGRDIAPSDLAAGANVAVINETLAKKYFASRNPVGATITLDSVNYAIVGVVRDFQDNDVRAKARRAMYFVLSEPSATPHSFELLVRVNGDPAQFVEPLRRAIQAADRTIPIQVTPLSDRVRGTVSEDLLLVEVTMFFCVVALFLAALGLYGVTAYSAAQRTSEFGLRAALGAEPGRVSRMVLGEAVRLAMVGVAIGVPAGLAATRLIRAQMFGVGSLDLPSMSVAVVLLVTTAVLASYLPARRAARVGPLEALRME